MRRFGRALVRPVSLAVVGLLFAFLLALFTYPYLDFEAAFECSGKTVRGSRLEAGLDLVAFGTPVAIVVILVVRKRRRLLVASVLAAAALIGIAIALVGLDAATYTVRGCGTADASFLYFFWGATILFLVIQASRARREAH
jgi:hypothetical protein